MPIFKHFFSSFCPIPTQNSIVQIKKSSGLFPFPVCLNCAFRDAFLSETAAPTWGHAKTVSPFLGSHETHLYADVLLVMEGFPTLTFHGKFEPKKFLTIFKINFYYLFYIIRQKMYILLLGLL